jgi:hypothetical protein
MRANPLQAVEHRLARLERHVVALPAAGGAIEPAPATWARLI